MTYVEHFERRVRASHDRMYPECSTWERHTREACDITGWHYRAVGIGCAAHHITLQQPGDPEPVGIDA